MELSFQLDIPRIALLDYPRAVRILHEELGRAGDVLMESVAAQARLNAPVDQGVLRNSIGVDAPIYGAGRQFMQITARTGKQAPYAGDIERGTKPHWISDIGPLKGWARRKLGNANLAYPVRRKIALRGTDPQPFMAPAVEKVRPETPIRLGGAIALAVERLT